MDEKRKKVLMMSHGVTGTTGFSNQLHLQSRALIEAGYDVYVIHRDYRGEPLHFPRGCGATMASGRPIDGMTVLPIGSPNAQWAEDVLPYYLLKYKVDFVHTLGDIWCYQYIKKIPKHHKWYWLSHYVFDTENVVGFWNECVAAGDISVVPAKFAYEMVSAQGHRNLKYIPHGIDVDTYSPATHEEKVEFRKALGIPEKAFVIGMVAHNQQRKMVNRLVNAFDIFSRDNPDAVLLLHSVPKDATGWDLPTILKDRGLLHKTYFTDKAAKGLGDVHVPESELRRLYCSMDIHALATGGEGFGVPIIEAMACGIPNVTTAYTTGKEFLCDAVEGEDGKKKLVDVRGICVPYIDIDEHATGGIWAKIDVGKMAAAFQYLKDNPGEAKQMGMKGREFVTENYDMRDVKEQWKELYANFAQMADDLDDEKRETMSRLKTLRLT